MSIASLIQVLGRARRTRYALLCASSALALSQACHGYFGDGPDPAAAGRVDAGPTGGNGGNGGGTCNPLTNSNLAQALGCPNLVDCLTHFCSATLTSCFGPDFTQGNLNGGLCGSALPCFNSPNCGCNGACGCDPNGSCSACVTQAVQCEHNNCQGELGTCNAAGGAGGNGAGGNGAGGNGGTGGICNGPANACTGATLLVDQVNVSDIALSTDTVFFSSNQGIAKILKTGGSATPLGGFGQVNAIALDPSDSSLYFVDNTGSLITVTASGPGQTLTTAQCGGSPGDVALDGSLAYFTTGGSLARFDRQLNIGGVLATDVFNGPMGNARIALDANNVYYISQPTVGGGSTMVSGVARTATGTGGMGCQTTLGTVLTNSQSTIAALIGDASAQMLFFSELGSNGLTQTLTIRAIVSPTLAKSIPVLLASEVPSANGNAGQIGSALASDGTYLYFGSFDGIYRVMIGGPNCTPDMIPCGAAAQLVPNALASVLAVDATDLYFGGNQSQGLYKIKKTP